MKMSNLVAAVSGSRHGVCERCHQQAELKQVKVKSLDGMPQYQYLCSDCAAMEKFIKC